MKTTFRIVSIILLAYLIFAMVAGCSYKMPIQTAETDTTSESAAIEICRDDDSFWVTYEDFAAAIVSGEDVSAEHMPAYKVNPKSLFSDTFVPIDIVFPFETDFDYEVCMRPEKNEYAYSCDFIFDNGYIVEPLKFRKSKMMSTSFGSLKGSGSTYVEGKANSIPYLKRSYTAHCYEIDKELHEHRALYMICGDSIYRVGVHPSYLDKYDIFSDEYIDRVTSYIRDNVAPKTGGLKEYDPEKSFLEIYEEATAK